MSEKIIIMPSRGQVKELAELFGVSTVTVWHSLRNKTKSEKSQRIRKMALQKGGIEATIN